MNDREARMAWFKAEVLPFEAALRRLLYRLLDTPGEVEDFAAEALARAYAVHDFSRIHGGRNYLLMIAHNLVRDAARRRKVIAFETIADLDLLNLRDDAPDPETIVTARDELSHVQRAVDALPERCRQIFLMRRVEELSIAEVAERLALSVSSVEKQLARALSLLTEALAEREPAPKPGLAQSLRASWRSSRHKR